MAEPPYYSEAGKAGHMGKGGSVHCSGIGGKESALNSAASWPGLDEARARVLVHQRKLHRWAKGEPARRFDDVFNLVCDRATLRVAWERVARNRGARTAGVDAVTRHAVERRGVEPFVEELRSALKDGSFRPLPVRQAVIPKRGGKLRYLGIPTGTAYCAVALVL